MASLFVDAAAANYLLRAGSPAVDAALPLPGIPADLESNPRVFGAAPDIGCYEVSPPSLRVAARTGGNYRLILSGGNGTTYRLERATVLPNWSVMASLTRTNQSIEWIVPEGTQDQFYRLGITP
jgi:hypothetical protein